MNSVHEPGSRTMSKNLTQEKYRVKSGQKQAECTECTTLGQPARPGRAPNAQATRALRTCRACCCASHACCRAPRALLHPAYLPSVRLPGAPRPLARPPAPARLPAPACLPPTCHARPSTCAPLPLARPSARLRPLRAWPCRCAQRRVAAPSAVSQRPTTRAQRLPMLYRDPGLPQAHNTVCIAIQTCCTPNCIAIQFLQQPGCLYCNTLDPLAIQFQPSKLPSLQYKNGIAIQIFFFITIFFSPLSCNTNKNFLFTIQLGSSPKTVSALKKLIFFFIINIFFSYFQRLENYKKKYIYIPIFFHFL